MKQSVNILKQALVLIPTGSFLGDNSKVIAPSRFQMKQSMESMTHHFKLFTEGFTLFTGQSYQALEAPKGEFVCF